MAEDAPTTIPPGKCPICGKPREMKYRPFCSKRCANIDLGRWLGEVYSVPVTETDDEDGEDATPSKPGRESNA
jgi:endogenous inhibitor of DNA gyrase (YacG/DUF329 family)